MVKKETATSQKILIKGTLVKIDDQGMHVLDGKSETIDVIGLDLFDGFIGKEITLNISDKLVETEILTAEEEEEEEKKDVSDSEDLF